MKKLALSILIFFTVFILFSQEKQNNEDSFAEKSIPIEEAIIKEAEFYQEEELKNQEKNPGEKVLRLGIGNTTEAITPGIAD